MDYNDYELVYMVRENDDEIFNLLVTKYDPLIKKLSFFYANKYKKFKIEREDLEQECRIGLCKALSLYNPDKEVLFYSFVLLCMKRSIYSALKRYVSSTKCCDTISLDDDDNYMQIEDNFYRQPSFLINDNYIILKIIDFKNSLDFKDSQIFELRYNSFSYKEIAVFMELDVKEIDNRLLKIRNKLKKYLLNL